MPYLSRRHLLLTGIAFGMGLRSGNSLAMPSQPANIDFIALRDGAPLGHHKLTFSTEGNRLIVNVDIKFGVKLAFIPVYRYRHTNREVWEDGRLVQLDSETDDNGDSYRVRARAKGDELLVEGSSGELTLPGDTPSTSYWNESTISNGTWLDTQYGRLARSEVTTQPSVPIEIDGEQIEATAYQLKGDIDCELWYRDGRWVRLIFLASDGSTIEYLPNVESTTKG